MPECIAVIYLLAIKKTKFLFFLSIQHQGAKIARRKKTKDQAQVASEEAAPSPHFAPPLQM